MKVFVAPLNWGLGHATRCVPLIDRYLAEGAQVTIGGDGESLDWLRRRYPDLPYLTLAPLRLHYSHGRSQVGTLLLQLPHVLGWLIRDHRRMNELQREHHFDLIISDNRFALFAPKGDSKNTPSPWGRVGERLYLTHQLRIRLPRPWRWLEPLAQRVHAYIINRYDELWVPDYAEYPGLAGDLSHPDRQKTLGRPSAGIGVTYGRLTGDLRGRQGKAYSRPKYIGPLSRFSSINHQSSIINSRPLPEEGSGEVLLLSGLEPQRSLFREWVQQQYPDVEVIEGCVDDEYIARRLHSAKTIIARSGYSTIMDLEALGLLDRFSSPEGRLGGVFIPTPGQPEQEYLAELHGKMQKNAKKQ